LAETAPTSFESGRYKVERLLGAGGMGEVWMAIDQSLGRRVAIKVVSGALVDDSEARARFHTEVQAVAAAEHPYIVPLYDVGFEDGRLFIVMRLVDGPDLRALCADGPLAPGRGLQLFRQVSEAVQAIHDRGIIHRDLKPANILIAEPGQPGEYAVLTDFGVARISVDPGLTVGMPPGTPRYMAPEIWLSHEASAFSDQYALACMLFEMLTGQAPFDAGDILEIRERHCDEAPPELGLILPEAPGSLADAIRRALSKDPHRRFGSVAEFAHAALAEGFAEDIPSGPQVTESPRLQLSPAGSSAALFGLAPDRDERAPQLAMETYLTLWANGYATPGDASLRGPKRRNGALRSLATGTNFLEGLDEPGPGGHSPAWVGDSLASGRDFANSANLALAQQALGALLDPQTEQGSAGASLMLPIHESLLWFDARKSGAGGSRWAVRKVNMRGSGITLARMLLDPTDEAGPEARENGRIASTLARDALTAPSPFATLATQLNTIAREEIGSAPEPEERLAWDAADQPQLAELGRRVARHSRSILSHAEASPSAKLLQLRSILALDLAHHMLVRSWEVNETPADQRFLLLTYAPEPRRENRVRIASEMSYRAGRQYVVQALIATIARRAAELATQGADFQDQFESRSGLEGIAEEMARLSPDDHGAFDSLAGRAYEEARGAGYGRAVEALRVLLESLGVLRGTGSYRWLRAGPELLAGMLGAVGGGPLEMPEFLRRLRAEWDVVVGDAEAVGTSLDGILDGALLSRNARHLERLLVASGLAQALSDQTCMVGQRLREAS
jgi:serine/threonine protein kinase